RLSARQASLGPRLALFLQPFADPCALPSFPTRRSSDLGASTFAVTSPTNTGALPSPYDCLRRPWTRLARSSASRSRGFPRASEEDRKSTRLNSSHLVISYAVFCLKKKTSILAS